MSHKTLLCAVLGGLVCFSLIQFLPAPNPPESWYLLRSAEDLFSLARVLDDETSYQELSSFCDSMALWKVLSSTEAAPEGKSCLLVPQPEGRPERIRHRFELASRKAVSTRVYQIDFVTCKKAAGEYEVEINPLGFRSDFSRQRPVLTNAFALNVLKLAVNHPQVVGDLINILREREIRYLSVMEPPGGLDETSPMVFHFVAADGAPQEAGTTAVVEYLAEYDPVTKSAVFTRLEGGGG